jgi:hypothetical protein
MGREGGDRGLLLGADADFAAAVAAIFRCQHACLPQAVEITFRPAVITALPQQHEFLGRQLGAFGRFVESRPVLEQLVAAVLGGEEPAGRIEGEALAIAQPRREAFGRGEALAETVRVVAPDAAAGFQLRAGLPAWHLRHPVLGLAGIGGGAEIDIELAGGVDGEGMHRMVAAKRQA